jgi:hypothetical protein
LPAAKVNHSPVGRWMHRSVAVAGVGAGVGAGAAGVGIASVRLGASGVRGSTAGLCFGIMPGRVATTLPVRVGAGGRCRIPAMRLGALDKLVKLSRHPDAARMSAPFRHNRAADSTPCR